MYSRAVGSPDHRVRVRITARTGLDRTRDVAPESFIVTYRLADVLGSPIVEGITVDRDPTAGTMDVSVIDSRFDHLGSSIRAR